MVRNVSVDVAGPIVTLRWRIAPVPGVELLNYQVYTNCTEDGAAFQRFHNWLPADVTELCLKGIRTWSVCTALIQVNTLTNGLATALPFTFTLHTGTIPVSLSLKTISTTNAVVTWFPPVLPSGPGVCSLHYYDVKRSDHALVLTILPVYTEVLLTTLNPSTVYIAYMQCDLPFHQVLISAPLTISTPPLSQFLSTVLVSHITTSTAVITWDSPATEFLTYSIDYGAFGSDEHMNIMVVAPVTNVGLVDLKASTRYLVYVSALTFSGKEHVQLMVPFTTQSSLNITTIFLSQTSVLLNWTCCLTIPSSLWEVQYQNVRSKRSTILNTTNTSLLLSDFEPGNEYKVTLTSLLNGFKGPSQSILVEAPNAPVDPSGAPSAPQDVRAGEIEAGSVLVSWTPPAASTQNIIKYNIYIKSNDSTSAGNHTTNTNYLYLQDLKLSQVYGIKVTAVNSLGEGLPSQTVSFRLLDPQGRETEGKTKPKLLVNESLSIRTSSIMLKVPDCGLFDKAAKQLDNSNGSLSILVIVTKNRDAA
eukprot:gi/632983275/ref/XP_007908566.1/ PREDICTED: phosphatidylinositol phosphatase PTPRQ-like [Callorhinchus milii]